MTAKQPTKFEVRYCSEAIEYLSLGHTTVAFAGRIGVPRETLLAWARAHPEFSGALKVGQAKATAFWEQMLADIASRGKGNATAAIFALKNCAAENETAADEQDKAVAA